MESFNPRRKQAVSYVFFCYNCGEIFAKAVTPGKHYQSYRMACSSCPPESEEWNWLPGSVWCPWDKEFNDSLPDAVIEREFYLHLAWAEKEMKNEDQSKYESRKGSGHHDGSFL